MRVKTIVTEDFTNYKEPAMFIGCIKCNWKCCREGNFPLSTCINNPWKDAEVIDVQDDEIVRLYESNPITHAIVFGLFEPFLQFEEIYEFVKLLRNKYNNNDAVVIYTGYNECEVKRMSESLFELGNVIIKFGRFVPNLEKHFDDVLGVELASPNQYAVHGDRR